MSVAAPEMPARPATSGVRLCPTRGFKVVSVREVAADGGVTQGSVDGHFRSRRALVQAAGAHYYRTYRRRIHDEIAPVTDPVERLGRTLDRSRKTLLARMGQAFDCRHRPSLSTSAINPGNP